MSKFQLEKEIELLNLKIEQLKLEIKDPDRGREGQVKGPNLMDALQYITDVVFSLDADGKITFVSASAFKSFGYSQDEMIGKLFTQFLPKEEKQNISPLLIFWFAQIDFPSFLNTYSVPNSSIGLDLYINGTLRISLTKDSNPRVSRAKL